MSNYPDNVSSKDFDEPLMTAWCCDGIGDCKGCGVVTPVNEDELCKYCFVPEVVEEEL